MPEWMKLVGLTLQISITLIVIAVGLHATWADATYLFRQPGLLFRSMLARNVLVPCAALLLTLALPLDPAIRLAILALSVTAIPPFLPTALLKAGGRSPYVMGLLISQTLFAVVLVPLTMEIFERVLDRQSSAVGRTLLPILFKTVLLPLLAGLGLRKLLGSRADRIARVMQRIGMALVVLAFVPIVFLTWRDLIGLLGNFALLAIVLFVASGLAAGHWLGGPREEDRTALALAAASSHPVLAIAVERATPVAEARLAVTAVLLYLIVRALVVLPYTRHRANITTPDQWRSGRDRREVHRDARDRRRAVG